MRRFQTTKPPERSSWAVTMPFRGLRSEGWEKSWALEAFALKPLAQQFAIAAHRFSLFARLTFRGLLEITTQLHFTENPFTLHFLLQRAQGLIDIIVADDHMHGLTHAPLNLIDGTDG